MTFIVSAPKTFFVTIENPMEEGMNPAVVSNLEDLGMQPVNPTFLVQKRAEAQKNGRDPNSVPDKQPTCRITYTAIDGKQANEELNMSLHEKATLFKRYKAITGEAPGAADTDIAVILGAPVFVQIERLTKSKTGKVYTTPIAKVQAVALDKTRSKTPAASLPPAAQPAGVGSAGISAAELGL